MRKLHLLITAMCLIVILPCTARATIERHKFNQIIEQLQRLYEPEFKLRQQLLQINGQWKNERMEASARYDEDYRGEIATITITGAVARHTVITEEAFATILCHEIGHFLGGEPAFFKYSTEGQADYFAASACMRRLIPSMPDGIFSSPPRAPWLVKRRCVDTYDSREEIETCIRTTMGGFGLSSFVAFRKSQDKPDFETPDPDEAKHLSFEPNTVQCRLDTFIVASLCNPAAKRPIEKQRPWLCSRNGPLANYSRPLCWYPRNP